MRSISNIVEQCVINVPESVYYPTFQENLLKLSSYCYLPKDNIRRMERDLNLCVQPAWLGAVKPGWLVVYQQAYRLPNTQEIPENLNRYLERCCKDSLYFTLDTFCSLYDDLGILGCKFSHLFFPNILEVHRNYVYLRCVMRPIDKIPVTIRKKLKRWFPNLHMQGVAVV